MKIAIVKLSSLGDIVHTMVVLQFIKKHHSDCLIDWIVEDKFADILAHNSDINKVHSVNLTKIKQKKSPLLLWQELKKIRTFGNYDIVIDAQGLLKSAIIAKTLKSKQVCGFDKKSIREAVASYFYTKKITIAYNENTIDRNATLIGRSLNIFIDKDSIINKKPFLYFNKDMTRIATPFIVFIVNSTWSNRNYPQEKFAEIANMLKIKCLVAWNNDSEKDKAQWLQKASSYIDILPKMTLNNLKYVISEASLVIGNDTGPTHIAWGLNVPSITIFGPTPVNRVYQTPINKTIKSSSSVNHYKLDKNDYSIGDIDAKDIVDLAKQLLKQA